MMTEYCLIWEPTNNRMFMLKYMNMEVINE
jgi:hypothetical protein